MSDNVKSVEELVNLLGSENAEQLKKNIVEIITFRVKDDLEHFDEYLLNPDNWQEIVNDVFKECLEEIKPIMKDKLLEVAMSKVNNFKWEEK